MAAIIKVMFLPKKAVDDFDKIMESIREKDRKRAERAIEKYNKSFKKMK